MPIKSPDTVLSPMVKFSMKNSYGKAESSPGTSRNFFLYLFLKIFHGHHDFSRVHKITGRKYFYTTTFKMDRSD